MPRTIQSVQSRRLVVAVFATLLVVALSFVGTFFYFNLLNQRVFREFEGFAKSANINAGLSRELVELELKIREMMSVVMTSPEQLPQIRNSLLVDFDHLKEDVRDTQLASNKQIRADLDRYKVALDAMLRDYAAMNETLLKLNTFYDTYTGDFKQLEKTMGQLIVSVALSGSDSMGLQQNYMLLPLCVEEFLNGHILIRSSITEKDPTLLGVSKEDNNGPTGKRTTFGHLDIMEKTLGTMTSAQEPIGGEAKRLIQKIPIYRQQVEELRQTLFILRDDSEKFTKARSNVLNSIEGIDRQIMHGIVGIRHLIDKSNGQELIVSLVISGSVLAISLLGLLVAWKMSCQLENTTRVAVEAESQQLLVNEQLTQEINQREKAEAALRQAHDDLELRVNERTAELSNANDQLQAEIIERLAAEKNLADERERLAVTLSSIGDGVISTDTAGVVTLLNQNAEKLTGWDQHDAIGRPLYEIFHILHEETRAPCASPVDKVLATGGMIELANHTVLIAKDGREINIADSGAPIHDKANRIIGVVLVFRDVTEQLKQEKELFSAQKMESIGTLAGGIAHDFNNILSAIIGYTELAMMRINPKEPAYEDLRQVRQASNRATDLVRQILTFSRQQQQAKAPLQLSLVVKEALKLLRASIPSTILFHQEIMSEATVMADPTQMHQVIMNLCTNAYHAMMEHGGVLRISLEEVLIAPTMLGGKSEDLPPGCYLRLVVSDSGCGMEKELMDKIFEPYFTTKEQGKGTGLGLAVVHGIVKSHDGRISVDSEPGRGTAFNVYLPMIVHDTLAEVIEEIPPMARTHERVMVVDDEGAIRDLTSQILIQAGYRVETFVNGLEAWLVLSQAPQDWDLLITDQTMPEMTGDQLAAKALELRPDLPILICSGYNAILLPDGQTKGPGVITYLQKPVGLNALLTQVAKSLEAFHAARADLS